jgi:hypothetical protein
MIGAIAAACRDGYCPSLRFVSSEFLGILYRAGNFHDLPSERIAVIGWKERRPCLLGRGRRDLNRLIMQGS